MSGKVLVLALVIFTVIFGGALWYFQTQAFYAVVTDVDEISVQGQTLPVVKYQGIDADTSPLKLRACFRIRDGVAPDALAHFPRADGATPLVAPAWFDCFDAPALQKGIDDGPLRPVVAGQNEPWGFDRIVATWPDGTGVMWRQMNRCGLAQFAGDPLPEGCPPQPDDAPDDKPDDKKDR
ncbi:MAG: hypothetical protein ACJARE_003161 [Paracoccaceae bacterium]|jgi:hypothetical protein